jgi:hypothetical protein
MTTYVEDCAGKKADYRVYYRKNGKLKVFFDAMFASSPEEAKALMLGFAKELRMKVEIIGVKAEASR